MEAIMDSTYTGSSISTNSCDIPERPPLMTIFYSGKVNVYQNVPADKAKAIMLLLSNDCSKIDSSCANNIISTGKPSPITIFSPLASSCTNSATSNSSLPPRPPSAASGANIVTHITSTSLPPRPPSVLASSGAIVTHITSTPPGGQMKPRHGPTLIKRSQAELPFARKASLTRFLQKRKDRVDARLHTESARCSTDDVDYDLISANVEESEGINPNKKKKN